MSFISDFKASPFNVFTTSADPSNSQVVGQVFATGDQREVTLVQNGTVALVAGNLVQHSPIVANHVNVAVAANVAVGSTTVTLTLGATVANANQYQGGFLVINAGSGIGQTFRILSSSATAASGTCTVVLEDAVQVALTSASSKASLIAPAFTGVVINPTTATASPAGVTLYPIPASVANTYNGTTGVLTATGTYQYGYIVTKGIVSCLSDANTATVGLGVMPSTTTAGTIAVATATGGRVGFAYQTSVSAEARAIYVNL